MLLFRWAVLLLLLAAGACFAAYALTGQPKYKALGKVILKWTLFAALGFLLVVAVQRVFD